MSQLPIWDSLSWDILHNYLNEKTNKLTKQQLDSYNVFINENIPKTIRQFNPIILMDSELYGNYRFEIIVGGEEKSSGEILNNGKNIFYGKPYVNEKGANQRILFPNEARLKSLTYNACIFANIHVQLFLGDKIKPEQTKVFLNIPIGNIPIMLHSNICPLYGLETNALIQTGECKYDLGGYFIIDGKEKVVIAQERQVENKLYTSLKNNDDKYLVETEIRSAPENKFQPARLTKIFVLANKKINGVLINENIIRVRIPLINEDIPLFILYRALGITTDKEILECILNDTNSEYSKKIIELLTPTIKDAGPIKTQYEAYLYLQNIITFKEGHDKTFTPKGYDQANVPFPYIEASMSKGDTYKNEAEKVEFAYITDLLRNWLLPHLSQSPYDKALFLGYMVIETINVFLKKKKPTDRDNLMYKCIDMTGFLISAIFRDLYFRLKNDFIERCNMHAKDKLKELPTITINNLFSEEITSDHNINKLFSRKWMDEGMMYTFKNCWGLKNSSGACKEGVVQDLNRLSYLGYLSHLRRINTPISASAKIREPHSLHASQWGIMCPSETPDGGNVGIRKNFAIGASITFGTNSNLLIELLYDNNLINFNELPKNMYSHFTKIFLNEKYIGLHEDPELLAKRLRILRRNGIINIYTSISLNYNDNILRISTYPGRSCRPLLILNNGHLDYSKITALREDKENNNWHTLLLGKHIKKEEFSDTNGHYLSNIFDRAIGEDLNQKWKYLEEQSGIIEYIDTDEENTLMIAMYPNDTKLNKNVKYTHCEINPCMILGVIANNIPFAQCNQAPRNIFSGAQQKQAAGMFATNYRNRIDTKVQILSSPQKPLVTTRMGNYLGSNDLPHGMNAIVAVACYTGYNQDDSIIMNQSSIERGMFHSVKFRSYSEKEDNNRFTNERIEFCNPIKMNARNLKSGNYNKLDPETGIVKEGEYITENDVVVGRCVVTNDRDEQGNRIYIDDSIFTKRTETGYVDKVYYNIDNNNNKYCKIRIRKHKIPVLGDKFASRHGQKGVIGMLVKAENMPFTKDGVVPDMIINPQAFPKRMTIGQFIECLMGKQCILTGDFGDGTPFNNVPIDKISRILHSLGYEQYSNELLYNPYTGEQIETPIFIGPTFYHRLMHQVEDKMYSRSEGPKTALSHQPAGGRALGGGLRIGEMERDALLSHGISSFLKESMMERSDKYSVYIDNKSGLISPVNPSKNIYDAFGSYDTMLTIENNLPVKTQTEISYEGFSKIELPYAFKLMLQEIQSMGIAPRLITESMKNKWEDVVEYDEPQIDIHESDEIENIDKLNELLFKIKNMFIKNISETSVLLDLTINGLPEFKGAYDNNYKYYVNINLDNFILENHKTYISNFTNFNEEQNIWYSNVGYKRLNLNIFKNNIYNETIPFNKHSRIENKKVNIACMMYDFNKYIDNNDSLILFLENITNLLAVNGKILIVTLSKEYIKDHIDDDYVYDKDNLTISVKLDETKGKIQKGKISYNDSEYTDIHLIDKEYLYNIFAKFGLNPISIHDKITNFAINKQIFTLNDFDKKFNNLFDIHIFEYSGDITQKYISKNKCIADTNKYKINELYTDIFTTLNMSLDKKNLDNKISSLRFYHGSTNKYDDKMSMNIFNNKSPGSYIDNKINTQLYENITNTSVNNTIEYMFNKNFNGIFVKIKNNMLVIFLPFKNIQNDEFLKQLIDSDTNELQISPEIGWDQYLQTKYSEITIDKKDVSDYKDIISKIDNLRLEMCTLKTKGDIINSLDLNLIEIRDMFETLCNNREIPDCEFMINNSNYPCMRTDGMYPNNLFEYNLELKDNYIPILSFSSDNNYNDIAIPHPYQWSSLMNFYYKPYCINNNITTKINWSSLINQLYYREYIFNTCNTDDIIKTINLFNDVGLHDSEINVKISGLDQHDITNNETYVSNLLEKEVIKLVENPSNIQDMLNSKYLLHILDNQNEQNLLQKMSFKRVIICSVTNSEIEYWFSGLLKPLNTQKNNIDEANCILLKFTDDNDENKRLISSQLEWCISNDSSCKKIAENAYNDYNKYFSKKGILDYLQLVTKKINKNCNYEDLILHRHIDEYKYIESKPKSAIIKNKDIFKMINVNNNFISQVQFKTNTKIKFEITEQNIRLIIEGNDYTISSAIKILMDVDNYKTKVINIKQHNNDIFVKNIRNIQNNNGIYIFNSDKLQYILIGKDKNLEMAEINVDKILNKNESESKNLLIINTQQGGGLNKLLKNLDLSHGMLNVDVIIPYIDEEKNTIKVENIIKEYKKHIQDIKNKSGIMINCAFYCVKQDLFVENDVLHDVSTDTMDEEKRVKKINYGAIINASIKEILAKDNKNRLFILNPIEIIPNSIDSVSSMLSYKYPKLICSNNYDEFGIYVFSSEHFLYTNGLLNHIWGKWPSFKSIKERLLFKGINITRSCQNLHLGEILKVADYDTFSFNLGINNKSNWYDINFTQKNDSFDVVVKLNNKTDIYDHNLVLIKDSNTKREPLNIILFNLKERLRTLSKIYNTSVEIEIDDIEWDDKEEYASIKNITIYTQFEDKELINVFNNTNDELDFLTRLNYEIDLLLNQLYRLNIYNGLQYTVKTKHISNLGENRYFSLKFIINKIKSYKTKEVKSKTSLVTTNLSKNNYVLDTFLNLDEPIHEEKTKTNVVETQSAGSAISMDEFEMISRESLNDKNSNSQDNTINITINKDDKTVKTIKIDLSENIYDNNDSNSINSNSMNLDNVNLNEEHESLSTNSNDQIEETKLCIDCGDDFITYSGKDICPECREKHDLNSENLNDIEIS